MKLDSTLCDFCKKATENKCTMYKKNPEVVVIDCGRFENDSNKVSYMEAINEVMKRKGGYL